MTPRAAIAALLLLPSLAAAQEYKRDEAKPPALTRPPEVIEFVPATYPPEAMAAREQADVTLRIDLDATGAVTAAEVLAPAGRGFDEAAVEAVRAFRFRPAEVDGVPAPIRLEYVYHFRLEEKPAAPEGGAPDATAGTAEAAEPGVSVKGVVRERGTRLPVVGAAVSVDGVEARTDAKGAFELRGLAPGRRQVRVVAPDYAAASAEVEVAEGRVADLTFALRPTLENAYETVVRGEHEEEVVARYTVSKREMTTVPGTFGDPIRVVQNLPGVSRSPFVLGLLLVRGAYPGDSMVYVDGVPVPLIYHFLGGPSILNPRFLDRIDFYPGNFGVRYGAATAGIIEVRTRPEVPDAWHGAADLNLLFAGGYVEGPIADGMSLKLALRRSYYDAVIPLALKIAGSSGTSVVPVYYDYQARFDAKLHGDDRVHVFAFGSDDALALATTDDRTSDQVNLSTRTSFHRLTGEWLWNPTATLSNRLSPTFGLDVATFDMGEGAVEMITVTGLLRDEVSWRLHPRLELRPGIEAGIVRYQFSAFAPAIRNWNVPGSDVARRFDAGFDETGEKEEISKAIHAGSFAAYVDAIWQPWDFLKVIPGVRAQSYFYLGREKFRADPRLTVRADVGAGVTLKAGAGLYSKLPPEFYLDPDYGNPDLDMEWAEQYSAGVEYTIARVLGIDLQGFYIRRHDKASRSRTVGVDDAGNVTRVPYENDARGRAYGLELLLRHDMTERFYGWLAYTLSRSEEAQAFDQELNPSRFDQTHILTAVASVRLGRGWEVGTRFRLVSGNPTTPRLDSTYLADTGRYTPYLGSRDSARLGLFHQLDFRVEKTWEFEKWMFAMYLDVQNVYYAKNPEFRIWDYRSRKSYEITGIPILPTLGFKGEF